MLGLCGGAQPAGPDKWEGAFGRVAAEARVSGIPVAASQLGAMPEAVGSGSVLLERDAPEGPGRGDLHPMA